MSIQIMVGNFGDLHEPGQQGPAATGRAKQQAGTAGSAATRPESGTADAAAQRKAWPRRQELTFERAPPNSAGFSLFVSL